MFVMSLEKSTQSKISYFENTFACDKQIGCLQISMNDVVLMKKIDPFKHLEQKTLDLRNTQSVFSPNLIKIEVNKLHYDERWRDFLFQLSSSWSEDLMNPYHILMFDRIEQFDLSDRCVWESLMSIFDSRDFFDRIKFWSIFVLTDFIDSSISALSNCLQRNILLLRGFKIWLRKYYVIILSSIGHYKNKFGKFWINFKFVFL